jgi:uncharacterized membrane protein
LATLATFDAQAILDTVDAGKAHDDWQVYRANSGYFLGMGIFTIVFALLSALMLIFGAVLWLLQSHRTFSGLIHRPACSWR